MSEALLAAKEGVWTFSVEWFMNCIMKQELDLEAPQFAESLQGVQNKSIHFWCLYLSVFQLVVELHNDHLCTDISETKLPASVCFSI